MQNFENHISKTVNGHINTVEVHDIPPPQMFLTCERNEKTHEYLVKSLEKAAE